MKPTQHGGPEQWVRDRRAVRRVLAGDGAPVDGSRWPATVPAVRQILDEGLTLPAGVTLLVGENGTGKSTIVEGVAMAFGFAGEGGTRNSSGFSTRASESPLGQWLRLERPAGAPHWGFFLRAETMHGYYTHLERDAEGRQRFHEMSHGESFLEVLRTRFDAPGLYCLDEPEAALSFSSCLALVAVLHDLAAGGAQVLCATHSPLLAALPGALVLEVGEWGLREVAWQDLEMVQHWRSYLAEPRRYLRHVIDESP